MNTKIVPKPARPQPSEAEVQRFIAGAPDAQPVAATTVAVVPATEPAPQLTVSGDVPRTLRKRKEPITVTVDPQILADFDKTAQGRGLSRAAALGLAMQDWVASERKRARE
ncbi:hypothetical protein GCM10007386_48800 [Pseudoduganella dura]|nr:hypothetical protein GCM10007386_48800 [Pseudoduganella dura]